MAAIENSELIKSVKEYITAVKKIYKVEKVFLFGSYIHSKENNDSDIDLAIVSSSFTGNRFIDNVNLSQLTWRINTRIEPVGFRPEDFNSYNLLADEIINTGIEIPID